MTDIATSADCYYEVIDVENLEFVFDEIAGNITVEPVSINVEYSTFKPMTNGIIQYKIIAEVTNNSKTTDLTNVFVHLDEGDNAEIITEYGEWRQTADMLKVGEVFECMWVVSIDITNYSDGGEHPFLVYAGSDQTATSSIQGSIAVIATDGVNNSLDFGTDVWNFHNFSEEAQSTEIDENGNTIVIRREDHPLTEDDWNALLACSPSERAAMVDYLSEGGTNGHCFGMSLTTILNKMNIFDISDYSDASCLREAELTERVWSILCYYQGLHSLNSFTTDYQGFLLKSYSYEGDEYNPKPEEEARQGVAEQLTILAEKADTVRSGSSPVLFCFGCDGWGSHAVVADETESGSWNWDGKVYNKRIHLYDCNAANGKSESPIWNNEHCLYFNEGTDEWIIPAYKTYENEEGETLPCMVSTNWKNAYLMQACNDLTILNTHNYDASLYNYIAELRCQNETAMRLENENKQYVIMGKSGSVTGDTELATYYDAETTSNESNTGTLHVILPDEKEDYTISTLSGKAEELDFYIKDEDLFLSLDADAAEGSAFGLDGVITVSGNAGAYEVKIADDNIAEGEFDTYTFSGENTGDVSFELTNDGVLITGDDLTDITVSGSEGNTETDVTFSTDYEEVLVVPNDDNSKLSVFVDSDNDDIYDTDISTSSTSTDGSTTLAGEVDNGDLADTDNADIPATGDNTGTWLWLAIFLVSGIGVITAVQFSHSQKKRESK